MCTVSFIPVKDKFIITSNRDEKCVRKPALPPAFYSYNNASHLLFPKDAEANGTWIALKENGDVAVLLNGAFIRHLSAPSYRRSRGLVLLDVLSEERPSYTFSKMDLGDIEPFTLVLFESGSLYEFRWDGNEKYCKQLSSNRPHIWSSATLYDGLIVKKREQWFASFLNRHPNPTQLDILNFHRFSGDGDQRNDLLMCRDSVYSTVSITSILLTGDRGNMKYHDVVGDKKHEKNIGLLTANETI
jgi:Transport and Golgi organisation 2